MLSAKEAVHAADQLSTLGKFMSVSQIKALCDGLRGEESDFFFDKINELVNTFNTMPKSYEQDGKGEDAIVYLHYFSGSMDFHITERDMENEQHQAYGRANLGHGGALGYISLIELAANDIELDMYWEPTPLKDC